MAAVRTLLIEDSQQAGSLGSQSIKLRESMADAASGREWCMCVVAQMFCAFACQAGCPGLLGCARVPCTFTPPCWAGDMCRQLQYEVGTSGRLAAAHMRVSPSCTLYSSSYGCARCPTVLCCTSSMLNSTRSQRLPQLRVNALCHQAVHRESKASGCSHIGHLHRDGSHTSRVMLWSHRPNKHLPSKQLAGTHHHM